MKLQEIIFNRPIKVLQIFRNVNIYGKEKKSFDDRKEEVAWNIINSKSGQVINGELFLPEQILSNLDLMTCDLITIEDDNQQQEFNSADLKFTKVIASNSKTIYNHCFHLTRPNKFDIFEIRKEEEIEFHLQYGYFEIGIPERKNFKLCEIIKNKPIEIKINGKTDSSLTSGRERIFKEQDYIIEYIGDFNKCKILKEPYNSTPKQIPSERKLIDLMKQLW